MRNSERSIGGYFELEISNKNNIYHNDALAFNTGRNAFEYILRSKKYTRIHMPYFTCDVMLQPIKKLGIEYVFYHIDDFFNPIINKFKVGDVVLYTNYFGLNFKGVLAVKNKYENIIIDNSQAFFDQPIENIPTIYSPRKFFGLPDGGFVYGANEIDARSYELDSSLDRMRHLLERIESGPEKGYNYFQENDSKLNNLPIRLMSKITRTLLNGIDFNIILNKRIENFNHVHMFLKNTNKLSSWITDADLTCPMVYPYWVENGKDLRNKLINNRIYTPVYWSNVLDWVNIDSLEFDFVNNIISIPIDQRYNKSDLNIIIDNILDA